MAVFFCVMVYCRRASAKIRMAMVSAYMVVMVR